MQAQYSGISKSLEQSRMQKFTFLITTTIHGRNKGRNNNFAAGHSSVFINSAELTTPIRYNKIVNRKFLWNDNRFVESTATIFETICLLWNPYRKNWVGGLEEVNELVVLSAGIRSGRKNVVLLVIVFFLTQVCTGCSA